LVKVVTLRRLKVNKVFEDLKAFNGLNEKKAVRTTNNM